jgi:hypothetical protein
MHDKTITELAESPNLVHLLQVQFVCDEPWKLITEIPQVYTENW